MHILIIPSFYPSEARPVTGVFFQDQAEALREAGHQVGVLVAPRIRETLDHIQKVRRWDAVTIETGNVYRMHRGWVPRIFPLICAFWHGHEALKAFERYVADHGKPDILHAHNIFYSGYMAAHIAERYDIPAVLTEHSSNFILGRIFLPGQHWVVGYTLERIQRTFAVGKRLAEVINQRYHPSQKLQVLHNIVDTDFFLPQPADDTIFTFAAIGQMRKLKRFDLLIQAFAQAFQGKNVRLLIGGSGTEHAQIQTLIDQLALGDQVKLVGRLSRDQVRDLFQKAHVVVSSSDVETFGVTLIEAMSCGKPVIATRSGGPENFITDEVGILVPTGDVAALAAAMRNLHSEYHRYDPQAIRQYCIGEFGKTAIVQKLETIYQQLLTNS
jgi:glycosyltransferase involved in cell wall biosynthesis